MKLFCLPAIFLCAVASAIPPDDAPTPPAFSAQQLEFFEREVRPLLVEHCYSCHSGGAEKLQAGLWVDSREGLLKGGDSGASVVPGDSGASLLIEAVRYDSYEMPPASKLPEKAIAALEQWVDMGAPWPAEVATTAAKHPQFDLQQRKQDHWVWQPVQTNSPPDVQDVQWALDPLDNFVLLKLEIAKLAPVADAAPEVLMRRLYFDLIGLPPTPAQSAAFLADSSPDRLEAVVDQLLKSPHFGERFGRHWLDLVRYAESRGHEFDNDVRNAYQYRDYVIRALNQDIPYDQFVREHIAGDLLGSPRLRDSDGANESILGTGFWFLGEWTHSPVDLRKDESDRFDNMIDVMSKTFLGVTVSCARCHDHKFDAISTADYYSLTGFLQSSNYRQVRFQTLQHNESIAQQLDACDQKYSESIAQLLPPGAGSPTPTSSLPDLLEGKVLVDYSALAPDAHLQNGFIFGKRPRAAGQILLDKKTDSAKLRVQSFAAACSDSFWDSIESSDEAGTQNQSKLRAIPRAGRTLRTPTFQLDDGRVSCRVRGVGHVVACVDSHRMVAGPLHGETIEKITPQADWVSLDLSRYVGRQLHLEFTPAANAQLEVSAVLQGATDSVRKEFEQLESLHIQTSANVRNCLDTVLATSSETAEQIGQLTDQWAKCREQLGKQIAQRSNLAIAMLDGTSEDGRLLIRGNPSKPGRRLQRHFLTAISGDAPMEIRRGSGRVELAAAINAADNPLTSRVIVNRVWHWLMGRGIVPTTDDFGVLGMRPTHPELLDYLAIRFNQDGQSLKGLVRQLVLSRTYKMSSQPSAAAMAIDPKNELWHHRPVKRLEGEAIRDALLSLAGKLDPTMYGESVPIHLTPFMQGRGRPAKSGPLDGDRRRSIYTAIRRNFLSPFMLTFDSPMPFSTMGRRNVSNVPAQALILMNDPLVGQLTGDWAKRACELSFSDEDASSDNRDGAKGCVEFLFQSAYARSPRKQELDAALKFANRRASETNTAISNPAVWAELAHALANTKEFIFLR